jgi:hypothetical protein
MKRFWILALTVLAAAALLAGCGSKKAQSTDLDAFYKSLAETYHWDANYMVDLDDDMLVSYYPGLKDLSLKQRVIKMPAMSSVVNELAFVEADTDADAKKAAEIFQKRIDDQSGGGAWYPDSMEAWKNAKVITSGKFVGLVASAEHQDEIAKAFSDLIG